MSLEQLTIQEVEDVAGEVEGEGGEEQEGGTQAAAPVGGRGTSPGTVLAEEAEGAVEAVEEGGEVGEEAGEASIAPARRLSHPCLWGWRRSGDTEV